jgi:hypothetical protein
MAPSRPVGGIALAAALLGAPVAFGAPLVHGQNAAPRLGAACSADLAEVMTLLPDEQTYAICRDAPGGGPAWSEVRVPFEPHESWLSYGPGIILHGQGMRNPNVTEGQWTATARDPASACRAEQQTVVGAGELSDPEVAEGEPGGELAVRFRPALFYLTLSGDCLWVKR